MRKTFGIPAERIERLVPAMGWCYASDHITVEGRLVGYLYREAPDSEGDSGWRFLSGAEDQAYVDNPENFEIYDVNTIANYDRSIIPLLNEEPPCAFERLAEGEWSRSSLPEKSD